MYFQHFSFYACFDSRYEKNPKVLHVDLYQTGESWYERPGCFHRISDNASDTERAVVLATFVIKTEILEKEGMGVLVKVEPEYLEGAMEQMTRCGTLVAL